MAAQPRYPCPCCGHVVFQNQDLGELCPVCFWEDDARQLRWPHSKDGPNGLSLVEAQQNYMRTGAMHESFLDKVRRPKRREPVEDSWRPINPEADTFEPSGVEEGSWPEHDALYWWRPTFWRHR